MNKKEKKQTKTLQRLAKAHNELLNLKGAESLEGKDDIILKALRFVGRITSFGTIEVLEDLMNKHAELSTLFDVHAGGATEYCPQQVDIMHALINEFDDIAGVMKAGFDDVLRDKAAYALMELRKHMSSNNIRSSMRVINTIRKLDALTQAKLDIEDALAMIGRNKPTTLIEVSKIINKEGLIDLILERK